jgi:hypothetical protein
MTGRYLGAPLDLAVLIALDRELTDGTLDNQGISRSPRCLGARVCPARVAYVAIHVFENSPLPF